MSIEDAVADYLRTRFSTTEFLSLAVLWSVVIVAAVVTYCLATPSPRSLRSFLRYSFPREIFTHPSAHADYLFWLSRRVTSPLLLVPLGLSTATAGWAMHGLLTWIVGPGSPPAPASFGMLCLFTASMLLAFDLSYYCYHVMQHKVPILWELHKVHHSAEVMVGVTKDRIHPFDDLLNKLWDGLLPGMVMGAWMFVALDPVAVTVFGINIYVLRNLLFSDFVRHTHLNLSFGRWVNTIVLCPYYHQLHHSNAPEHHDKNFGLALVIWDRMFRTLVTPRPGERFTFGLTNHEHKDYHSLLKLYVVPLVKISRMVTSAVASSRATPPDAQGPRRA